ncbi:S9 family peptidase [Thalassomonas haliotis]|uniref:S9 family peptidase n=1 Tax=Thalassomonas haliotis TaxID=485448 RepID=A0ABY7V933_9GAMM|nr:S9 family peptidase [Thalassomonas haliotis]WDE10078.1 S9 family peptidase [Thalassomonas haliotis]
MKKLSSLAGLSLISLATGLAANANAEIFTVEALNNLNQLHDVKLSPDGNTLVYGLKKGTVSKDNHLYRQDIKSGKVQQLTSHKQGEYNVVFSGDGQSLYFLSGRSGSSQIWQLPLNGGEARQITDLALDIDGFTLSEDEKTFALAMTVKPGCQTLKCTVDAREVDSKKKHNVRTYDQLMVRHWDTWLTEYKEHLFVASLPESGMIKNATDIMPNWQGDIAGIGEVSFHPQGKTLVFSAKQPAKDNAWTTNFDLFELDLASVSSAVDADTEIKLTNITADNKAWDAAPVFSPNGRFLAYKAMSTPGYESDKFSIRVRDNVTGQVKDIAKQWDRSVKELKFSDDSRSLFATAQDVGQRSIFAINPEFGDVRNVYNVGSAGDLSIAGDLIVFTRHTLNSPKDVFAINSDGYGFKQLTDINKDKLADIQFGDYEQFNFKGWNNETVHGYWMKPANFEQGKKYPIAYLVHGGPQGSFGNMFHYRWNAQLWAAQGYGVVMVDFHGSIGYGQAFTDSIARDWGGKPLEDLQKGLAHITQSQKWLDGDNACALGASYGGYMMNWIAGNWPDRFKCLINHAGLFDMPSFYTSTEELWFPEHDMGGPLWQGSEDYNKFNPAAFVNNWQTPTLVIQGELDYRVPYAQSLGAFTTLQRKGIDSRLVVFPGEDHHIRNPDNLIVWYQEVFDWLARYTGDVNAGNSAETSVDSQDHNALAGK